ncbi:hypothetical protein [Xenorhabdus bovienii]|nr:hypothetical protein [Xenorhabdus bovienii]
MAISNWSGSGKKSISIKAENRDVAGSKQNFATEPMILPFFWH